MNWMHFTTLMPTETEVNASCVAALNNYINLINKIQTCELNEYTYINHLLGNNCVAYRQVERSAAMARA